MTPTTSAEIGLPRELVERIVKLCAYVGDHGGGDRTPCKVKCPSCEANEIGLAITMAGVPDA